MKMREGSLQPCRNHGGLVLTCLIMVSLLVTNTSGEYQGEGDTSRQSSSALPESKLSEFNSSSDAANPPSTGTFLMECTLPYNYVHDLCWLDENTMVTVHYSQGKVLKTTINRQTKTCSYSVIESWTGVSKVACSPDGEEIYVVNHQRRSVWVYDRNSVKAVWNPVGLEGDAHTVAINRGRIVVSVEGRGPLYVYDRNRVYVGVINILQNQFKFDSTHLTEEGLFVAVTADDGHRLIIHDFTEGSTVTVGGQGSGNGQFNYPAGVSTVGDYILVGDFKNNRVPVFSKNGGFQRNIQFKGTDVSGAKFLDYRSDPNLLCLYLGIAPHNKVKVFSLL